MEEKIKKNNIPAQEDEGTRLNKYLASAGISSRRKADELIAAGEILVNGEPVTQMGYRVFKKDKVTYNGKTVRRKRFTYLLLNKPKDYITSTQEERGRKSVMELVRNATKQRVFPVGQLDKNTTGLILITNDGDLSNKLAHPESYIEKIYKVELNRPLTNEDLEKIKAGIQLEDGIVKVDEIDYAFDNVKKRTLNNVIGIKFHTGKNKIIRRIFNELEYRVLKLDRTYYAGLTKKNLARGDWRMLAPEEVIQIKHLGDRGFKNSDGKSEEE